MTDESDLRKQLQTALAEGLALREEVRQLKDALARHSIPVPNPKPAAGSTCLPKPEDIAAIAALATNEEKITLFRSLFRGREDVYAVRIRFKKDGTWGYVPDGETDWSTVATTRSAGGRKADRPIRTPFPLTDEVIRLHLTGKKTVGIYPLLLDETCWLLAADFDKSTWQDDALAFVATCTKKGVPAYLERSRSGRGGHVWIFFEAAVPAALARRMGCAILTETMERRHLALASYDRFFPNQDTMPKGGFGNLIALPLQWMPRQRGDSLFVDDSLTPYPDQWKLLASVRHTPPDQVEWIVNDASRRGQIVGVRMSLSDGGGEEEPWTLPPSRKRAEAPISGPFPEQIEIVLSNMVFVPKAGLPEPMLNRLLRLAAFQNPEFYKTQSMRLSTWDKPRVIFCGEELPKHVALPRGCIAEIRELMAAHGVRVKSRDERSMGHPTDFSFVGTLTEEQTEAVQSALKHDAGILCAPTGFGKTVVGATFIATRKVNTLVMVHRQQLLDQWRERLAMFLGVPLKSIGQVSGGKQKRTGSIDVALIQSLQRKGEVKDFVAEYGQVIVDECHHISAVTFDQVMKQVKARYVVGLTATPTRKDGHHPIIFMQCGPVRFSVSPQAAAARSPFEHLLLPRCTDFRLPAESKETTIHDVYAALITDGVRNQRIIADILDVIRLGRTPLVLTNRTEHIERLASGLTGVGEVLILKGGMGSKQRQALAERLTSIPESVPRVILATGSYIGEGFDDSRLDTLFLTMPISWYGTLQQYVGRLHRIHHGKKVVRVYDYVDAHVPMLARMYEKRLRGYRAIGYRAGSLL